MRPGDDSAATASDRASIPGIGRVEHGPRLHSKNEACDEPSRSSADHRSGDDPTATNRDIVGGLQVAGHARPTARARRR